MPSPFQQVEDLAPQHWRTHLEKLKPGERRALRRRVPPPLPLRRAGWWLPAAGAMPRCRARPRIFCLHAGRFS